MVTKRGHRCRNSTLTLERNIFVDLGKVHCVSDMAGLRATQWAVQERRAEMSDRISAAMYGGMSTRLYSLWQHSIRRHESKF
jgi:hypothetical protein